MGPDKERVNCADTIFLIFLEQTLGGSRSGALVSDLFNAVVILSNNTDPGGVTLYSATLYHIWLISQHSPRPVIAAQAISMQMVRICNFK